MLLNQPMTNQPTNQPICVGVPHPFATSCLSIVINWAAEAEGSRFVGGKLSGWWLEPFFFGWEFSTTQKLGEMESNFEFVRLFQMDCFEPPS